MLKIGQRVKFKQIEEYEPVYYEGILTNVYITPNTNLWEIKTDKGEVFGAVPEEEIEVIDNG